MIDDLTKLDPADARLIQIALRELGFYDGTTEGRPATKTAAAYGRYLASLRTVTPAHSAEIGDLVARIARKEIGVREEGGPNRGARVREYQAATNLEGTGWPYCAAFVCWCVREAAKTMPLPFPRPTTAGAWDLENWARKNGVRLFKPKGKIKRGDILVYTFSHTGLAVEDEKAGMVEAVEGNTDEGGGRDGEGVFAKLRSTSLVRSHIRLELAA